VYVQFNYIKLEKVAIAMHCYLGGPTSRQSFRALTTRSIVHHRTDFHQHRTVRSRIITI